MKNIEKIDNTWYNHYVNTQLRNAERRKMKIFLKRKALKSQDPVT